MRVAFLGLGLIGGSLALATRSPERRRRRPGRPRGDGPRAALAAGAIDEVAATPRGGRRRRGPRDPRRAAARVPRAPRRWLGRRGRASLAAGATVTDVASTKGRSRRPRATRGAAVRRRPPDGRAARPPASRRPTPTSSGAGRGSRPRPSAARDPRCVERARDGRRRAVVVRCARATTTGRSPRSATCRSSLSAALVEAVPGMDDAPAPPDCGRRRARWRPAAGATMTRLAQGDVAMGDGHRGHQPGRAGRAAPARIATGSTSGSRCSTCPDEPDAGRPRASVRGARVRASAGGRRASSPTSRSSSSRARRSMPGVGWLGVRARRAWPRSLEVIARARGVPATRGDGGRPGLQAGHPVPRAARRRALVPDAPDPRRWRRRGCTIAGRSGSAGTSTRATATSWAGSAASGARSSIADFEPAFRAGRAAQRRQHAGRRRPSRAGVRRRCGRPPGRDPRDREAQRVVRAHREVREVREAMETWSWLVFDALTLPAPVGGR